MPFLKPNYWLGSLYNLNISPYWCSVCIYFFTVYRLPVHGVNYFLWLEKICNLKHSQISVFAFVSCVLVAFVHSSVLRHFLLSFQSFFGLIFVFVSIMGSGIIFWARGRAISPIAFIEDYLFFQHVFWTFLMKLNLFFISLCVIFLSISHCIHYYCFVVHYKVSQYFLLCPFWSKALCQPGVGF